MITTDADARNSRNQVEHIYDKSLSQHNKAEKAATSSVKADQPDSVPNHDLQRMQHQTQKACEPIQEKTARLYIHNLSKKVCASPIHALLDLSKKSFSVIVLALQQPQPHTFMKLLKQQIGR